ncbi:ankyrin-2 isoform X42 [Magallana gigas]|uniref:ankyrin-2 isoform X42 n=1 Tax=Magallana gigas TaxID=29159 RepID=UPI00333F5752
MANFFTSASTNFVLDHQLSPRRLSTSSHHVEFRDMPRRLSAHVEFRDLPCSHIDGHLQPPPHLYHRRRSSDVSHDRRHHHHHHKESDGNTSFLRAARDGNLQEVLEYLKGSTDINTSNPNGLNALHLASKEGHIDIVQELLKRGANVEAATKKGNTALHIASLAGHLNIVNLLVENGAKYDVQAHVGFTPLYMAAQEGHADVVKYLLSSGANQSLSTKDGFTPLAVALQQGHERVVSVLLENDTKGKVKLPALHVTARKDDVKSAALLLQNEQNNVDGQTKTGGLVNDTTKSGFTPLHIAAHYGNTNVGSLLIQRGADVNFKAKNNITPLHVASRWGKPNMVTLLLDNHGIADERTRDGLTPLHCAARSGHENVVDLLIERGAPKSAKTKNGLTPLHMAAQGDHVDCARLLLYHRAPVDDVTVDYLTPLHVAAHCGNVKTAKLLLDRKCDPNSRALNGFTPLHIACKKNRIKVVELLLKYGATIEATTESGLTPLHVASFMGHMNIVIYLIQNNANPDFTTVRGETALHLAARANQTDIIRILLRNGATVDARAREQQTPLHIAARLGNVDNVTLLLQLGAAPDAVTKDLYTPLHIAAKEGHEEVASVLLEHGASHSLTTKKGFTPLHIAAKYGNIKVARLLLQKDANPDCQGKNGLTPLHVATHYNHVNVALLLLDNKASPHSTAKNGYTPLHIASKKNQMDIATTLLEFGARPDAESKNGFSPLHLAAQEGHTDMVSLLLEHKADVNSKAHNGLTSLHLAAQEDKVNVAEVLVKYGTSIDPQTKAGYTPLHTACHFGQMNMVRFLLEQGASVSATTKLGYTPLHQAAQQGHVQVINLLLKNKASPNAVTNNGQTALSIAQRLGYISVVDTLTPVTEVSETLPSTEDKIKLMSPEIMQENPISDSDDEGGSSMASIRWDDFLPSSPLFGKPLTEQHVYLPGFYEGSKMQSREDSISLGEKGGSISPLDTSYEKDVSLRTASADARPRITSEIGTSMRYPSYLERGPDYEAEMRYFSGDSLMSPRDKSKDSVFGGDYSTLDRLDTTSTNSESKIRVVDEHGSEIDYDDDLDDRMKKNTAANQFTEDFYLRQSVRYGANTSKRPIYPSSGYKSVPERPSESYAESFSVDGIDLNEEFKYMPDDSVPQQDYCEAQIMTSSYAAYTHAAPPETHLGPGVSSADKPRVGSYSGSSFSASFDPDNVAIDQTPAYSGRLKWKSFLISFMVDARGGAMRGRRHSGIRIIIPPNRASMPTRVTCRLIKKDKLIHPIPIGEGEALAARIIEMGPVATKFLGRIVIEIPHFASLRGKEREIKIMRSNNGDKWEEHSIVASDDAVQKALSESMEDLDYEDELAGKRVTRILTDDFPRYFALVTKVREEKQMVGEEGLILSSTVVPQVQAVFPKGAVNKSIKVGLQAQPISPDLVSKLLGNRVAVSPIVTLEPRRRRFHTAITVTIPVPKAAQKGMINQYEKEAPTLRVMYSIAASNNALRAALNKERKEKSAKGTNPALWDDLTDQTQLTFIDDCVSFNTNVSGRFMLMDCQNVADACRFATELYREAIIVPYMARFVVFAKRTGEEEGKLRMFCMTDDRIDKTLEKQENFREVARSRDVEVLEGRPQYVEMAGNLIPITKSGDQLYISFKAFRENRLPCLVKIRDRDQEPAARVAFMKEPKVVRGELPQTPICNLNISLPDMSTSSSMEMDPEAALELKKRSSLLREHGIVVEDTISKAKINLSEVADTLKGDWVILATQLDISGDEIHKINSDYRTVNDQALAMLSLWKEKKGDQATGNELERALKSIKREDVVQKCMYNVEVIQDQVEMAAAKVAMDQSGFDTFAEEIGATQDSMKRNMSLDVQFDEQEVQKLSDSEESESVSDSPASAPQAYEEDTAQSPLKDDMLIPEISERRALAKEPELPEKTKDDFFDLIDKLDKYNEFKEKQERPERSADTGGMEDSQTITEEELTSTKQDRPKSDEIIAKVEELGQNMAPARAQEPTEDDEGTKTPPPSPVEGDFVSDLYHLALKKRQDKLAHEIEDAVEQSVQAEAEAEEEEEEEEEEEKEETIIEETFQESDDGVTWRTIRKTTIITPEGQTEKFEVLGEEVRAQQAAVDELAARLSSAEEPTAVHPGETVIETELEEEEEVAVEQVLPDGSKVRRKRFKSGESIKSENGEPESMELVEEEGPEKEAVHYEENEEILEDGTVHKVSRTRRQSLKRVKRTLISESGEEENIFDDDVAVPGKAKEDVIEVFEEPAKPVTKVEEVEVVRDDGKVMKKRMVMNRMVSNVKTFHQSFDDAGNLQEDEYEIEAIIPGTESTFVEGDDSTTSSSSSEYSDDDDDGNDEEIDVEDLDLVEEDCQSGTTVTTKQVIKQTFTSRTYETEEPKELEETGLVKRVVKKVTYDPRQADVVCDSSEYDDEAVLEIETPVITITEANSKPANEGDDHLAYFGYKCSSDETELWIDENDFEEACEEVEEENVKSFAEIVHMFEKESQGKPSQSETQKSSCDDVDDGSISFSNYSEQPTAYLAEKEIIIVDKTISDVSMDPESKDGFTEDDTKPVKVHHMVKIFEQINSQSSIDEPSSERKERPTYKKENLECTAEHVDAVQSEQESHAVYEQDIEMSSQSDEETRKKKEILDLPEKYEHIVEKPEELKLTEFTQEYETLEETTSPLVLETVSPVARIVEDIESNVSKIQEATVREQVIPTEQVTEVDTKDPASQYVSLSNEIHTESIEQSAEEVVVEELVQDNSYAEATSEITEMQIKLETVEIEENFISEKDLSPICDQSTALEDMCGQQKVSEAEETLEPKCLTSSSVEVVKQYSNEQSLDDKESKFELLNTDDEEIIGPSRLETHIEKEEKSDSEGETKECKEQIADHESPEEIETVKWEGEIETERKIHESVSSDFQVIDTQNENLDTVQEMTEKDGTETLPKYDVSPEEFRDEQTTDSNATKTTSEEVAVKTLSQSQEEYEIVDSSKETKDEHDSLSISDEEDWELLDKDEIEDTSNIPDETIENNELVSSEPEVRLHDQPPKPCVSSEDVNSESEEDTTEIADRSETCDIESPIEFKQPFEKFEEVNETKTVQFDNKVLEIKSTSTGIDSSVETRDIVKDSTTSIEEEDIESISSTEEYKIRKYEYDQEIKEKDTISKQLASSSDQVETSFTMDGTLVRSIDTLDTDTEDELKTSVHEKHEYEQLSSQKLLDEQLHDSNSTRIEFRSFENEFVEQEPELTTPTQELVADYELPAEDFEKESDDTKLTDLYDKLEEKETREPKNKDQEIVIEKLESQSNVSESLLNTELVNFESSEDTSKQESQSLDDIKHEHSTNQLLSTLQSKENDVISEEPVTALKVERSFECKEVFGDILSERKHTGEDVFEDDEPELQYLPKDSHLVSEVEVHEEIIEDDIKPEIKSTPLFEIREDERKVLIVSKEAGNLSTLGAGDKSSTDQRKPQIVDEKELSTNSLSDEDLVERPKRISISQDTLTEEMLLEKVEYNNETADIFSDSTDPGKGTESSTILQEHATDLLKPSVHQRLQSTETVEDDDEEVSVKDEPTGMFEGRIEHDIISTADAEMEGIPVDFIAHSASDDFRYLQNSEDIFQENVPIEDNTPAEEDDFTAKPQLEDLKDKTMTITDTQTTDEQLQKYEETKMVQKSLDLEELQLKRYELEETETQDDDKGCVMSGPEEKPCIEGSSVTDDAFLEATDVIGIDDQIEGEFMESSQKDSTENVESHKAQVENNQALEEEECDVAEAQYMTKEIEETDLNEKESVESFLRDGIENKGFEDIPGSEDECSTVSHDIRHCEILEEKTESLMSISQDISDHTSAIMADSEGYSDQIDSSDQAQSITTSLDKSADLLEFEQIERTIGKLETVYDTFSESQILEQLESEHKIEESAESQDETGQFPNLTEENELPKTEQNKEIDMKESGFEDDAVIGELDETFIDRTERFITLSDDSKEITVQQSRGSGLLPRETSFQDDLNQDASSRENQASSDQNESNNYQSVLDNIFQTRQICEKDSREIPQEESLNIISNVEDIKQINTDIGTPTGTDERPLSPSSYTLETDTDMEGSRVFENDEECDVEETLNNDQNLKDLHSGITENLCEKVLESLPLSTSPKDGNCPPSPSEFTLVMSQDQDMLSKALGIDHESPQCSQDNLEVMPECDTRFGGKINDLQGTFHKSISVDDTESLEENSQESIISREIVIPKDESCNVEATLTEMPEEIDYEIDKPVKSMETSQEFIMSFDQESLSKMLGITKSDSYQSDIEVESELNETRDGIIQSSLDDNEFQSSKCDMEEIMKVARDQIPVDSQTLTRNQLSLEESVDEPFLHEKSQVTHVPDDEYDSDKGKETYNECSPEIETEITTVRPENASTEMPNLQHQVNKLTSESRNVFSSYENVYEGVPLDPKINRLSLDASELDVGDRFDTKQMDLHLRTNNRTSSYEQVYAKDLTDQSAHSDLAAIDEDKNDDKISSSSSEVAQHDDDASDEDAEACEAPENNLNETDVEEQFSPVLAKQFPKPIVDLHFDTEKIVLSVTESPTESHSPTDSIDSPDLQDKSTLPKPESFTVGTSPSDFQEHFVPPSDHEAKDSTKDVRESEQKELKEHSLICSYKVDKLEEEVVLDQSPEMHVEISANLQNEYPDFSDSVKNLSNDISNKNQDRSQSDIEISPEDLEEKHFHFDMIEKDPDLETTRAENENVIAEKNQDAYQDSDDSSETNEMSVFDECSRTYIRIPWESAYQFRRQFSETYEQNETEKKYVRAMKSIDMGSFFRRDKHENDRKPFPWNEKRDRLTKDQKKEVRFAEQIDDFTKEDDFKQSTMDESEDKKHDDESSPHEPHEQIDRIHEMTVIQSIMEKRQYHEEELIDEIQYQDSCTSTRDDQIEASGGVSCDVSGKDISHEAEEDLFRVHDSTADTTVTPTQESVQFAGIIVTEAEPLEETEVEETIDDRKKIPSSFVGKFPMALPSIGKAIADNEIYESSETGGDTTEEKLSPIEEAHQDDFPEEQEENKPAVIEKHVTFQNDVCHLRSGSSEDLVKTSTSSSEMEPTILAASYDLDSGRVSKVVATYDVSPDTVEKQFVAPPTAKAILSSPEDDVFELENKRLFESSQIQSKRETNEIPSAPQKNNLADIQEIELQKDLKEDAFGEDSAASSPFEIMSESELDGYEDYLALEITQSNEKTKLSDTGECNVNEKLVSTEMKESMSLHITPKSDSSFDHSSLLSTDTSEKEDDSPYDILESVSHDVEHLPDVVEDTGDHSIQVHSIPKTLLPNGPTEVEFNPEIDLHFENSTEDFQSTAAPPDLIQSIPADESLSKNETVIEEENEQGTGEILENVMYDSQTVQTHSVIEELTVVSQEHLISSDQTLYGLEMPSEETTALTLSSSQTSKQDIDNESDSVNVTEAFVSQTEEDISDQSACKEIDISAEHNSSKIHEEVKIECESDDHQKYEQSDNQDIREIYHGKRALNVDFEDSTHLDSESTIPCETIEDDYDNVEDESLDTNLMEEENAENEGGPSHQQSEPFELDVDMYDLERPCTPTPVDKNQHFFDEQAEQIVENEDIEVQANVFVESVLNEACARINKESVDVELEANNDVENASVCEDVNVEQNIFIDNEGKIVSEPLLYLDNNSKQELCDEKMSSKQTHSILMKQVSEDIPEITLTTHYHVDDCATIQESHDIYRNVQSGKENDIKTFDGNENDNDKPIESEVQQTIVFSSECIPEEPEDTIDATTPRELNKQNTSSHFDSGKVCIPEENDSDDTTEEEKEIHITSSTRPLTVVMPQDKVDRGECNMDPRHDDTIDSATIESEVHAMNEYSKFEEDVAKTGYVDSYESDDSLENKYEDEIHVSETGFEVIKHETATEKYISVMLNQDVKTSNSVCEDKDIQETSHELVDQEFSQDDIGDTSSVESFTTVVPVDQDDDEDGNENRLDDFASMSSSYHSDVLGLDEDEKLDDFPIIDWTQKDVMEFEEINRKQSEEEEKRRELKRKHDEELLQRFEELKSLRDEKDRSLVDWEEGSESSVDSDRYEYMDKTALSVITENSDEDKFEFLDNEDVKSEKSDRIFGSPDDFPPPSPGINKFFNKSADRDDISITSSLLEFERLEHEILASGSRGSIEMEKDNISVTSSLAEFERFERELGQSSSASSVEKITSDSNSKESDKEGSRTSLNDVDRLDKDIERKDSVDSITRRSESSSLASLNEFERLEQEMALADELEAEAQKIVSILESGTLMTEEIQTEKSSTLMTYRTVTSKRESKKETEETEELEDSLSEEKTSKKDLDQAEVDSLDGDVSEITSLTSSVILNQKAVKECDEDSLRDDEESMKISSDSLGDQLGLKSSSDKDKYDTDSLAGQEGLMEKSTDSLETDKKYSVVDEKEETDSLYDEDERPKQTDIMQTSIDSLESSKSRSRENLMESSMYSVDSSIFSRSSVETMKSAGSQRSDSSTEIMQVSAESYEERKRREKKWLIDNYHSYRESGHGVEPLVDQEGNVLKSFRLEDNYGYGWDDSDEEEEDNKSSQSKPFSWGPYEEKKKIYTMAEWEAMKEEKRRASLVTEKTETHSEIIGNTSTNLSEKSTIVSNTTISTKSITSSETKVYQSSEELRSSTSVKASARFGSHLSDPAPQRIASIDDDDFVEYDVTEHRELMHGIPEHFAQKSGPIYIDPETIDSEEDEIVNYPQCTTEDSTDGAEGGDTETHRLTMKKEIHTRTVMKDGREQTFVHEEAQIEQEEDTPEELKDSMQQIIDQFMESPAQPDQYKALEHDV